MICSTWDIIIFLINIFCFGGFVVKNFKKTRKKRMSKFNIKYQYKNEFKTSFYRASFGLTLSGELLSKFAQTCEAVCTELAEDARKHLSQLLGLCMACDGECVCRQRRLHFGVIEVDHCTIILYHVHLQSQAFKSISQDSTVTLIQLYGCDF